MIDQDVKLSIGEQLSLFGYGFALVGRIVPRYLPCALLRSLIISLQPMLVLFFSARILNELGGRGDVAAIVTYAILTVGLMFALTVFRAFLSREVETYTGWERLYERVQLMQAERFTAMDYAYAEDAKLSEALARMDVQGRGNGLGLMNVFYFINSLSESLFSIIFAFLLLSVFSLDGGLTGPGSLLFAAMLALSIIVTWRYSAREALMLENMYAENAKANTAAKFYNDYIEPENAAKDIRLYDQNASITTFFKANFNLNIWMPLFYFFGRREGFVLAMNAAIGGAFFLLVCYSALDGQMPVGAIIQSVGAITVFATAIGTFLNMLGRLWSNASFLRPLREFLTLPDLLKKGDRPVAQTEGHQHVIEFRNVSFRYPAADTYALRGLNLRLTPGERLAVVGLNGSGKTTMIKLLCRLYDPSEGEILLDGVNIKEYDYGQYLDLFSVVFQDYMLFPLWLGQNVAAAEDYDKARVSDCLARAGFAERLAAMPDGLDTFLFKTFDEDGTQVSGGEAQKIALARALYKNAPIVVLDEPTAALDPIAEYEVYTTFDQSIGQKTAVFISHRLSSCRFCGRIAVFDSGALVQLGSHEELLADQSGRYHELWEAQASHYREG